MSGSAQALDEQGTGKTPSQEVLISLSHAPKAVLTRCPVCAWPQFGRQLCGECSPDSHPLLPCQLLVFLQTPAERALLQKDSSPAKPKSGPSHPTPHSWYPVPWQPAAKLLCLRLFGQSPYPYSLPPALQLTQGHRRHMTGVH